MRRAAIATVLAALLGACGADQATELERSCRGELVLDCDPYAYTVGRSASFEPGSIRPGDTSSTARVRFDYEGCVPPDAAAASVAEVQVSAIYEPTPGVPRVVDLGIVLRDDASGGGTAGDGVIEGEATNPFALDVPGETDVTLRFVPVRAGCSGEAIELPYRTGPRVTP